MKLYRFINEDEQKDKQYRAKSMDLFRKLSSYIRSASEGDYHKIKNGNMSGSLAIMANDIDPQYSDLIFFFTTHKDKYSGVFGTYSDGYMLALSMLDSPLKADNVKNHIYAYSHTFVHEMAHYWEASRWSKGPEHYAAVAKDRATKRKEDEKKPPEKKAKEY